MAVRMAFPGTALRLACAAVLLALLPAAKGDQAGLTIRPQQRLHRNPPLLAGCHIDLGYSHEGIGISSQLLFSESFESSPLPPSNASSAASHAASTAAAANTTTYWEHVGGGSLAYTQDRPFNGLQSARLSASALASASASAPAAGVRNKGFHGWGFRFESGRAYEGYVFARVASGGGGGGAAGALEAALVDDQSGRDLAAAPLRVPADGEWHQLNFTLQPSGGTGCHDFPWGTPPLSCYPTQASRPAHACWQCDGSFVLRVAAGTVDLDMASLQPGAWGRFQGLPVRADMVQHFAAMGIDSIRLGGTYVKTDTALRNSSAFGYRWRALRGPVPQREPIVQTGAGLSPFWGGQVRLGGGAWVPPYAGKRWRELGCPSLQSERAQNPPPSPLFLLVEVGATVRESRTTVQ